MIFAGQIGACQITAQIIFGSHIIRRKRIADLIQGSGNGNETADVVVDQKLAKLQLLFFFRRIGMYGADITLFPEKRCNVADRISPEIVVLGGNQKGDGVGAFGTEPLSDSIGSIAELFYGGFDKALFFIRWVLGPSGFILPQNLQPHNWQNENCRDSFFVKRNVFCYKKNNTAIYTKNR